MKIRDFFFAVPTAVVVLMPQAAQGAGWSWWYRTPPAPVNSIPELSLGGAATGLALTLGGLLVFLNRRRRRQQ